MEEISGQIVVIFWGYKKQDYAECLKINNLQSLVVPRAEVIVADLQALIGAAVQELPTIRPQFDHISRGLF